MPESSAHSNLVTLLSNWIMEILSPEDRSHMFIDNPDNPPQKKPPKLYDFVPDIFVSDTNHYACIIGEAKTASEIDNDHTLEQLTAFLRKCSEVDKSLLVLAVPWHQVRLASSVVKYCKRKEGLDFIETKVIDRLPG